MGSIINIGSFPRTEGGRNALMLCLQVNGYREIYPDGSMITDGGWDDIPMLVDDYIAQEAQNV